MIDRPLLPNAKSLLIPQSQFHEDLENPDLRKAGQEILVMSTKACSGGLPMPTVGTLTPSGWTIIAYLRFNGEGDMLTFGYLWALKDPKGEIGFALTNMRYDRGMQIIDFDTAKKILGEINEKALAATNFAQSIHLTH